MTENYRNPFLVYIFTMIGARIRFGFFYVLSVIRGNKTRSFPSFTEGFNQIVYNIVLTFLVMMIIFFGFIFYMVDARLNA